MQNSKRSPFAKFVAALVVMTGTFGYYFLSKTYKAGKNDAAAKQVAPNN